MPKSFLGKTVIYVPTDEEVEKQKKLYDGGFCNVQPELPAVVVKEWGDVANGAAANLNVLMDGQGSFWSTSKHLGTGPGTFRLIEEEV